MAKLSNAKAKLNTETDQIAKDVNNTFERGDTVVSKEDETKKLTVVNIDPAAADDSPVVLKDEDGFTVRMTLSELTNKFTKGGKEETNKEENNDEESNNEESTQTV